MTPLTSWAASTFLCAVMFRACELEGDPARALPWFLAGLFSGGCTLCELYLWWAP